MREYELEVLEQYHMEVKSTRKIRGAFFCDTDQGVMALRETNISEARALYFYVLLKQLEECGYGNVDTMMPNAEGKFISNSKDGRHYVLKKWFCGNECDVKNEHDILQAVRNLAKIHLLLYWKDACSLEEQKEILPPQGSGLIDTFTRHNQELTKVRKYIRSQPVKREFEACFLRHYEEMYAQSVTATEQLKESGYVTLREEAIQKRTLIHGDYNYHNIIFIKNEIATTNFDKAKIDVQVSDLAYFIRKVMEKQRWRVELGRKILSAYMQVRPLSVEEREYILIRLSYPEKFWKTVNGYYMSNKSWISAKMVEKLEQAVAQTVEKRYFLEKISTFLL